VRASRFEILEWIYSNLFTPFRFVSDDDTDSELKTNSIDTQVANFHQKMAKSMHSLLQAFDEGFSAMDKAKKDEGGDS
jgi:hypothetical protein